MQDSVAGSLIQQLLRKDPLLRQEGSYSKLKLHRWFESVDWVRHSFHSGEIDQKRDEPTVQTDQLAHYSGGKEHATSLRTGVFE